MHRRVAALLAWGGLLGLSQAACPYARPDMLGKRDENPPSDPLLDEFKVDDSTGYMTSDVGGPIEDQFSLKAGIRGPTLLEDFIFRQKIQHFDHERVSASVSKTCGSRLTRHPQGSRKGGPCSRFWGSRHLYQLWRLEQPHRSVVSERRGKDDARVCALLDRCRIQGQRGDGQRRPRLRNPVVSRLLSPREPGADLFSYTDEGNFGMFTRAQPSWLEPHRSC